MVAVLNGTSWLEARLCSLSGVNKAVPGWLEAGETMFGLQVLELFNH